MKNLFGAGATAFLTCLDMAVKSEVEKWPDEEEKPFADSKKIVLRKVHNKGMCMSLLKEYPQFVKYTSLVMAANSDRLGYLVSAKKRQLFEKSRAFTWCGRCVEQHTGSLDAGICGGLYRVSDI